MPSYRFDSDWVACTNDNAAMQRAEMLLENRRRCRAIEVWQGTRRVRAVAAVA